MIKNVMIVILGIVVVLLLNCCGKQDAELQQLQDLKDLQELDAILINNTPVDYLFIDYNLDIRSYEKITHKVDKITAYNPVVNQTDAQPLTTASNRPVYEGCIAISQDIVNKYKLKFGDLVFIPSLNRTYIYEDKMAYGRKPGERVITNTIDVFMYNTEVAKNFLIKDEEVVIYKISRMQ